MTVQLKISTTIVVVLMIGSYISLSAFLAYDLPQADYWEWLHKLLIPYLNGEIDLLEFLSGAFRPFTHSHIPTLLVQLANHQFFDLRYDLECYIGLVATLLAYGYLIRSYYVSVSANFSGALLALSLCAASAILLNPFNINPSGLVQFEYVYLLVAVLYLAAYNSVVRGEMNAFAWAAITFGNYMIGDAMGTAAMLAAATHLVLIVPLNRKMKIVTPAALALLAGYIVSENFFTYVGPAYLDKVNSIPFVLSNKLESLVFIAIGYSQGIIDQHSLVRRLIGEGYTTVAILTGAVSLTLSLCAFVLYVIRRNTFSNHLPALLIIYSGIIVAGIMLSRFPLEGPLYALNDRYQRLSILGIFGAYWIFSFEFFTRRQVGGETHTRKSLYGAVALQIVSAGILLVHLASSLARWTTIEYERDRLDTMAGGIVAFTENPEIDIYKFIYERHCYSDDCVNAVYFLKNNRLSVFRQDHYIHRANRPDRDYLAQKSFFAPYDRETHGKDRLLRQ